MAIFKCTAKFRVTNATAKTGGWSESIYLDRSTGVSAMTDAQGFFNARIWLAAAGVRQLSTTVVDIANPGISYSKPSNLMGIPGHQNDIPQMALNLTGLASSRIKRNFQFPCVPDGQVTNGALTPTPAYRADLDRFKAYTLAYSPLIRAQDRFVPRAEVLGVSSVGVLTVDPSQTWTQGLKVRFYRTFDTDGKNVSGDWLLGAPTSSTVFPLLHWPAGRVVTKGKVMLIVPTFVAITEYVEKGVSVRKVGRPSEQYVGRRSRKR